MYGAELGERIHDVVGTVATEVAVFAVVKHLDFGRTVGIGEYLRFGVRGLKGISSSEAYSKPQAAQISFSPVLVNPS